MSAKLLFYIGGFVLMLLVSIQIYYHGLTITLNINFMQPIPQSANDFLRRYDGTDQPRRGKTTFNSAGLTFGNMTSKEISDRKTVHAPHVLNELDEFIPPAKPDVATGDTNVPTQRAEERVGVSTLRPASAVDVHYY